GLADNTAYNPYSLLATLEKVFGLGGCLQASCSASTMDPLFETTGASTTPALPPPFTPAPDGSDTVSSTGSAVKGSPVSLGSGGWEAGASPRIRNLANKVPAPSAGSAPAARGVGHFFHSNNKATRKKPGGRGAGHTRRAG